MPRPRKESEPLQNVEPGPIRLEVRVNDKIVFLQRVHDYTIDQGDDAVTLHGSLRPVEAPVVVVEPSEL
jgi:hypothetical protein